MLTRHDNAHSTCSQKVRLVLAEKGLDFKDVQINFAKNEHLAPEYLALNPNGVVLTLETCLSLQMRTGLWSGSVSSAVPEVEMGLRLQLKSSCSVSR